MNHSERKVSIWVKLFVLFHVVAITVWALPAPPRSIAEGKVAPAGTQWIPYWNDQHLKTFPPFVDYLAVTGFWQYWDMFSPDPAQVDNWCDAVIVYRDGTAKRYQYPRMFLLSVPSKFMGERFRKLFEREGSDDYSYLWPVFGFRMAMLNDNPSNPPVEVQIYRHWKKIVEPGAKQSDDYATIMYYDYAVDQMLLEESRRHSL